MMFSRILFAPAVTLALVVPTVAHHLRYTADLTGPAESPANNSPGLGHVVVTLDLDLAVMEIEALFSGLEGSVVAAHIHAATAETGSGTAGVATQEPTFADFPAGVTSGTYEHEFDLASAATYSPTFISATGGSISTAMNALLLALDGGKAYFNIHTTAYGGGEIRGFLSHVPGDYNLNGVVDAADYVVWRHTLGDIGDGLVADSNENSMIDNEDLDEWRENFGHAGLSSGAGSGSVVVGAVPEPTKFLLLASAGAVLLLIRGRCAVVVQLGARVD